MEKEIRPTSRDRFLSIPKLHELISQEAKGFTRERVLSILRAKFKKNQISKLDREQLEEFWKTLKTLNTTMLSATPAKE